MVEYRYVEELTQSQRDEVLSLIAAASNVDETPAIAENVLLALRYGSEKNDRHLLACDGGVIAGYAHIDPTDLVEGPSTELVVHPDFRGRGVGGALLGEVRKHTADSLRLWSHGDSAAARSLAIRHNFTKVRTVIQMRRSLMEPIPHSQIATRAFTPADKSAWVELNNRAFEGHPEQSGWTLKDLEIRLAEEWFDPSGLLIAEQDGELKAFCWTKIHSLNPVGEIYIMAVDPSMQRKGLGREMVIAGLHYIRGRAIQSAMLYVDAENTAAQELYKSLGFTDWGRDLLYKVNA
jgi:mycothiol synthase